MADGGRHANFPLQARALFRKCFDYQKRSFATNASLIIGPIFFCALLTILQAVTNNVLRQREDLKCGCQCTRCCKDVLVPGVGWVHNCTLLAAGYCDEYRGYVCEARNESACGPQYSSAQQAIWCGIPTPSIFPPVIQIPRPRYFALPYGPYNATPLVYTADTTPGARSAFAVSPGPSADPAPDVYAEADQVAAHMLQLPKISPTSLPQLMGALRGLVSNDNTVFNGHLLSQLGFQFANARRVPSQYYLDNAFVNSGSDAELDTLFLLMPNNTCQQRNMSLAPSTRAARLAQRDGVTIQRAMELLNIFNLTTFLHRFYSYDYPNLDSLLAASGVDLTLLSSIPLLSSLKVACVDVPTWRIASQEALDLTLWCGFKDGYPIPPAECYKATSTNGAQRLNRIESYSFGYNFLNASSTALAVDVMYNLSLPVQRNDDELYRIPALVNLAVRGWLQTNLPASATGGNELLGLQSMPKQASELQLDFSSLIGPLFYAWVLQLLLPTLLQQLVYEKEQRLRLIMKQHGLGDAAYWVVTYVWAFMLYVLHTAVFILAGSALGLQYFRRNSYGIQILFYVLFGQTQLAFCFLLSALFTSSRTATVVGYLYVLATGLLGYLLLNDLMDEDPAWMWLVELVPAFALYRGLYELGTYAFFGVYRSSYGMRWSNLYDDGNGMITAWVILAVEWPIFMLLAWYLEQVVPTGNGTARHPLFFMRWLWARQRASSDTASHKLQVGTAPALDQELSTSTLSDADTRPPACVAMEVQPAVKAEDGMAQDVLEEQLQVEAAWSSSAAGARPAPAGISGGVATPPILCHHLKKEFDLGLSRGTRVAVQDLSLAVAEGECFGLLGPNGAGKTSTINMLTGLLPPTSGDALVCGNNVRTQMQAIYKLMGVCPQHNLLWEQLTGREHLRFYGRLKGLTGNALEGAIDAALKSVNLYNAGVGDKQAGKYSGGMKRRLSVAISFIGAPRVVYLDEPSTGLDPASRRNLWEVVKSSKAGRSIILTTHSMEEAEQLCDRLGIFVDGQLVCIGAPKEITSRYAGFYVFTLSVPAAQEVQARDLVTSLTPHATLTYSLGGTLKYELPSAEVSLAGVFKAVKDAKAHGLNIIDWGVANATLEEVFIKLARRLNMAQLD